MDRHPFLLRMILGSIQLWIPSQVKCPARALDRSSELQVVRQFQRVAHQLNRMPDPPWRSRTSPS